MPIIFANIGNVKEHIKNSLNDFLIPIDFDASSVADIVRAFSNNFTLYNQIAVASSEYAVEYYDITNFRKLYQKLFE